MEPNQVETILKESLSLTDVRVTANGNHFEVIAVGDCLMA